MTEDVPTLEVKLASTTFERGRKQKNFFEPKGELSKFLMVPVWQFDIEPTTFERRGITNRATPWGLGLT